MSFFSSKFKIFMGLVMVFTIALVCILKSNGAADEGVTVAEVDHKQHLQEAGQIQQDVTHPPAALDPIPSIVIVTVGVIFTFAVIILTR